MTFFLSKYTHSKFIAIFLFASNFLLKQLAGTFFRFCFNKWKGKNKKLDLNYI